MNMELNTMERTTRSIIGGSLVAAAFLPPIAPAWLAAFCITASYPLMSALLGKDPLHSLFESAKRHLIPVRGFHGRTTA